MKTIVAIATTLGTGGVAIVRLSGSKSRDIASKICKNKLNFSTPGKMQLAEIKADQFTDQGMAVYFAAPKSYTGEDIIELHTHGGYLIPQKVVAECIKHGAVQAQAGEFSQRAFINGKISLDKAEGIVDAVNAESEAELTAAAKLAMGDLAKKINKCQQQLREVLAAINTLIDFPSEDGSEEDEVLARAKTAFSQVFEQLAAILKTFRTGRMIKSGVMAVLCGRPNAGKSSVLNALASADCAIVSSLAGTTRDIVKETILHGGIKFNLCDTAGLRVTTDEIEQIGVAKARDAMQKADIILYIIDGSVPITNEDLSNLQELKNNNLIVVINKTDLITKKKFNELENFDTVEISTINKNNIELLKERMLSKANIDKFDENTIILTNARHMSAISEALISFKEAEEGIDFLPLDVVATLIQNGYNKLGQVTGESGSDAVAAEIFSKFCVGK